MGQMIGSNLLNRRREILPEVQFSEATSADTEIIMGAKQSERIGFSVVFSVHWFHRVLSRGILPGFRIHPVDEINRTMVSS